MSSSQSPAQSFAPSWKIPIWFTDLDLHTQKTLKIYWEELIKFNKKVNLVSPKTINAADSVHFGDSIKAALIVYKNNKEINSLFDLGSGNGFPGLVFGLMYPNINVTLVDVDQRKCEFLKHVISKTLARNVSVSNTKVENFKDNGLQTAITRGFASIPKALFMLNKSVQAGGSVYFLKSEEWSQEVSSLSGGLASVWAPELIGEYSPPDSSAKYFVVRATKANDLMS